MEQPVYSAVSLSVVISNQHYAHFWVVQDAMCGLALTYHAQGLNTQAQETARSLLELVREQHNQHDLVNVYAFQAKIAQSQDKLEEAEQWLEMAGEQAV